MKKIFGFTALALLLTTASFAQEVKIDKDKVLIDNKEVLKYEKIDFDQHSLYDLEGNEILLYKFHNNETHQYLEDDYIILNFLTLKTKVESKEKQRVLAGLGLNSKKNVEKLIAWLLKEKVIDANGVLNADRVEVFNQKYNENITERTIR
ncbi:MULTISPECIES: hypothetical protein [unclassified Flavobacterium]|uniref:hypothetical protein n=1 Tax=unclassified Flavobacterium TaxID=196869 RepID=UPI0036204EFD